MSALTRRGFLRIAGLSAFGATAGLAGCGESRNAAGASAPAGASSSDASSANDKATPSASTPPATLSSASLVLVFSRAGENYGVGAVEVGNTMVLARMIAEKTGADLLEIERAEPYPEACEPELEKRAAA